MEEFAANAASGITNAGVALKVKGWRSSRKGLRRRVAGRE